MTPIQINALADDLFQAIEPLNLRDCMRLRGLGNLVDETFASSKLKVRYDDSKGALTLMFKRACAVVLAAIVASSCGGDSISGPTPTPTPTPTPISFDGTWSGVGVGGVGAGIPGVGAVQFVVQNNVVTRFSLTYEFSSFPPGCTFSATENAAISNGGFSFAFQSTNQNSPGLTTQITGTFTSASMGRVNSTDINWVGVVCGSSIPFSGSSTPTSLNVSKETS